MAAATILLLNASRRRRQHGYYGGSGPSGGSSSGGEEILKIILGLAIIFVFGTFLYLIIYDGINDPISTCPPYQGAAMVIQSAGDDGEAEYVAMVFDYGDSGEIYGARCKNQEWQLGYPSFSSLNLRTQNEAMRHISCPNALISQKISTGDSNKVIGIGWVCPHN